MATPVNEVDHVKRIARESQTYYEILHKLGLGLDHYQWIVDFVREHKVEMKEL